MKPRVAPEVLALAGQCIRRCGRRRAHGLVCGPCYFELLQVWNRASATLPPPQRGASAC